MVLLVQLYLWKSFKVGLMIHDKLAKAMVNFLEYQSSALAPSQNGQIGYFLEIYVRGFREVVGRIRDGAWCGRGDLLPPPSPLPIWLLLARTDIFFQGAGHLKRSDLVPENVVGTHGSIVSGYKWVYLVSINHCWIWFDLDVYHGPWRMKIVFCGPKRPCKDVIITKKAKT